MRRLALAFLAALPGFVVAGVFAPAASADVVGLTNGDVLYGQLDGTTLPVESPDGTREVSTGDLSEIRINTMGGDVLHFRNGTAVRGWIVQSSYAVRLASGHTITIERSQLAFIGFPRRR